MDGVVTLRYATPAAKLRHDEKSALPCPKVYLRYVRLLSHDLTKLLWLVERTGSCSSARRQGELQHSMTYRQVSHFVVLANVVEGIRYSVAAGSACLSALLARREEEIGNGVMRFILRK